MRFATACKTRRVVTLLGIGVISVLLVVSTVELLASAAWSLAAWLHPDPLRPQMSPAYAGAAWVTDLFKEQSLRVASPYVYVPFRVSGVTPWHGKYFNNDEHPTGVWRRTINLDFDHCQPHSKTSVWVFGGSTVYGTGVPDWATLPSYLSHSLNQKSGACVVVTNFGDEGYATTQELVLLIEQLKRGGKPDIVIFYDGFNDAHLGMESTDPWSTHYGLEVIKPRAEGSFRGRLDFVSRLFTVRIINAIFHLFWRSKRLNDNDWRARAIAVLDNYQANQDIALALAQRYHFGFYEFWQPMLFYGNKPLVSFERQLTELDWSRKSRFDPRPVIIAYQEAERRASKASFVYLGHVFDSIPDPVYTDEAHLGPHGNELVANAIASYIENHPAAN